MSSHTASTTHADVPFRSRPHVLLTTEGTYPHYRGGVSTWCDFLIRGVQDVDITIWALMMNPFIRQQYAFPSNVAGLVGVPLWGVEQPAEYTREVPSGRIFQTAQRTRERDVTEHFIPLFTRFLDQMSSALFDPDAFAQVLVDMHAYFREWEYRATWRSRIVWETFKQRLMAPTGLALPAPPDEEEDEGPLPAWTGVRASLGHLLGTTPSNGAGRATEEISAEVPTVGEATEGLRWLYRLLQTLNVDVPPTDLTHSAAAAFCAIPCVLAKMERGTPFLLTEHGVYLREQYLNIERRRYPYNLKRFLIDFVSAVAQTAYHMADQISPVCAFNSRWEFAYGATQEQVRVIYNGVSPDVYRPLQVSRPQGPTVVQVGRIDPLKDQITFLRVADAVRREIPDVRFLQWGNVSDDEYWQDVQRVHRELGLEDTVRFLGFTDKVAEAYAAGDISLMTSISEAFPYGVVESLMCGRPIVSTEVGGVREALGEFGMTAPSRDVDGLARAVVTMLRRPADELAQLSRGARQRAVDNFTLDRFIGEYRESYLRLAALGDTRRQAPALPDPPAEPLPPAPSRAETEEIPVPAQHEPAREPAGELTASELTVALRDPDPFVRTGAIARAGRGPGVAEALIGALADPYPQVRREAIRSLARIDGSQAAHALIETATGDPSPEVREEAVAALGPLLGDAETDAGAGA